MFKTAKAAIIHAHFSNIISEAPKPKMTKNKPTRSVRFAVTSQLIIYDKGKDDSIKIGNNQSNQWYSAEDKARFERETSEQAQQLRTAFRLGFVYPHDFSEDELINCTGIERLVLIPVRMLRQLQEMKQAHIHNVLAAQHHRNTSDLSRLSRRSSDNARQRAYLVATL